MNIVESLLSIFISPWQFFKESVPAPYIEVKLLESKDDHSNNWQELKFRPESLSLLEVLKRLFYNRSWNEAIYIYDCAERLIVNPSIEDELEISNRIRARLNGCGYKFFQFRIIFIARFDTELESEVLFSSELEELKL